MPAVTCGYARCTPTRFASSGLMREATSRSAVTIGPAIRPSSSPGTCCKSAILLPRWTGKLDVFSTAASGRARARAGRLRYPGGRACSLSVVEPRPAAPELVSSCVQDSGVPRSGGGVPRSGGRGNILGCISSGRLLGWCDIAQASCAEHSHFLNHRRRRGEPARILRSWVARNARRRDAGVPRGHVRRRGAGVRRGPRLPR
mmetsp:Transcript_27286/g.88116  ORF Transcript_27286/g.88116 Transcript_27286/m.88116 type:complete len:202 (-) Transcript_27286:32-637(-)